MLTEYKTLYLYMFSLTETRENYMTARLLDNK